MLQGDVPSPANPPSGCPFHPRCQHPLKDADCAKHRPPARRQGRRPLRRVHQGAAGGGGYGTEVRSAECAGAEAASHRALRTRAGKGRATASTERTSDALLTSPAAALMFLANRRHLLLSAVRPCQPHPLPFPWRPTLSSILSLALLQLPGVEAPDMTFMERYTGRAAAG